MRFKIPKQEYTPEFKELTDEGWLYLAVVLDLFNREIVGWSSRIITSGAPCEIGVEGDEIIATGGQRMMKRLSEVPALPHFPGRHDNCPPGA